MYRHGATVKLLSAETDLISVMHFTTTAPIDTLQWFSFASIVFFDYWPL